MEQPWLAWYEPGIPHRLAYSDLPLDTLLTRSAQSYPHHIASTFVLEYLASGRYLVGGQMTYQQLEIATSRFAVALQQLGIQPGDRVGLMLPNSPQYLIGLFGIMRAGAIVVPINPAYTPYELGYQLQDSAAETLVLLDLFVPHISALTHQHQLQRLIITRITDTLPVVPRLLVAWKQRTSKQPVSVTPNIKQIAFSSLLHTRNAQPPPVKSDAVALLQYTSGTTGIPRAAQLTHRNLMANTAQNTAWFRDGKPGEDKVMSALPFYHTYGLSVALLYAVSQGIEQVILPDPRSIERVLQAIHYERCTLFPGVPALYWAIIRHPTVKHYNLKQIRACISGAAPLPGELQEKFEQLISGRLVEGYGLSEASPVTHCNPLYGERRSGSIGIPYPDVEARLVDPDTGTDVPFDGQQVGELLIRGPQVMRGYWQRPKENAQTLTPEGWLHTGDLCRADPDGYFYLVDRLKDMMIVGGFKVIPREVEAILQTHPKISEVVVVGIPRPDRGDDNVKAYIVPATGETITRSEVRAFCKLYLAPYKLPREIELRTTLPRSLTGKALRRQLIAEELTRTGRKAVPTPG